VRLTTIFEFHLKVFSAAVPHATTTSDIYKGYFIPKGGYHGHLPKVANDE
jgi:hypothetical protein